MNSCPAPLPVDQIIIEPACAVPVAAARILQCLAREELLDEGVVILRKLKGIREEVVPVVVYIVVGIFCSGSFSIFSLVST